MTSAYPLLRHGRLEAIVAVYQGRHVTAGDFLSDAASLADRLRPAPYVINLCKDRYRFTVALAAALMREQVTLLPPNDTPAVFQQLAADYSGVYCLHDAGSFASSLPSVAFSEGAASAARRFIETPCFPDSRPAVILFTSGSTGKPAPHLKSWGCLARSARSAGDRLGASSLPGATVIGTVPQQHSYGLESTVMLALQHGLVVDGARPFYPGDIIASIAAAPRPRVLVTTPFHLHAIVADTGRLPTLDLIVSATAPLSPRLASEAERRFQAPLLEIYGCSEAGQLAVRRTTQTDEWQCLDAIVLDQDQAGTWASGALVPGRVLLADVIELRGAGRFVLHGRTADLVNIAGKRTSLAYLNHQLNSIPGVVDGVYVMPEETSDATMRLIAFAVAPGLSTDTVLFELRQRIDPVFLPRPLLLVGALPRNVLGKLPREALVRMATAATHQESRS